MYKVYVWTNAINGKRYVGTTGTSMEKRAGANGKNYKGSPHFYSAIQKYGFANFSYVILADNLTKEAAAELEKKYIKDFNTMNPEVGYNLQTGGFPENISPEISRDRAARISETLKAQRASAEYRQLMKARAKKVWDDPDRHAEMLAKRQGKAHGGNPKVSVFCEETGIVYSSLHAASRCLNVSKAFLARVLSEKRSAVVGKHKGKTYHIHKVLGAQ